MRSSAHACTNAGCPSGVPRTTTTPRWGLGLVPPRQTSSPSSAMPGGAGMASAAMARVLPRFEAIPQWAATVPATSSKAARAPAGLVMMYRSSKKATRPSSGRSLAAAWHTASCWPRANSWCEGIPLFAPLPPAECPAACPGFPKGIGARKTCTRTAATAARHLGAWHFFFPDFYVCTTSPVCLSTGVCRQNYARSCVRAAGAAGWARNRPPKMLPGDIASCALRPSSDTNTASLRVAKAARTWAASASVPAWACRANWYGHVARSNVVAHCLASVLDTR